MTYDTIGLSDGTHKTIFKNLNCTICLPKASCKHCR